MATGIINFMLFAVAIIGGFIEQMGAFVHSTGMVNIGILSSLLMPTDAVYRMALSNTGGDMGGGAIAEFGPFGAASVPSNWMLVYCALYIIVLFWVAVHVFKHRDL
ncbi:MAG TPA: hypothetical protein VHP38_00355 [Ruminiclostridium sp.]|nr:hypothetical protein [Ruminiclostridium sp.]